MDAFEAAARYLAAFDPLAALRLVALSDAPRALMLRGVAMAQLGEFAEAHRLLGLAEKRGLPSILAARCLAAQGEICLAERELDRAKRALDMAERSLEDQGDRLNARYVRLQRVRRLLLVGDVRGAGALLATLELHRAPATLRANVALTAAEIALRELRPREARAALARARALAHSSGVAAMIDAVDRVARDLVAPAARLVSNRREDMLVLDDVARLFATRGLVVDACRRRIVAAPHEVELATRPVLLALAVALGKGTASRVELAGAAFGAKKVTESIRVRLRVEIGRLRRLVASFAEIVATPDGFALESDRPVSVLLPPAEGEASAVLALLAGGEAWSTSALAAALGKSQRAVQRALATLREGGRVAPTGLGRAQRWVAPPSEVPIATTLLLLDRPDQR